MDNGSDTLDGLSPVCADVSAGTWDRQLLYSGFDHPSLTCLYAMIASQAEELNRFREEDAGSHYGYPYCWTEYLLPEPFGLGTGSVWAWPDFMNDPNFTDEQCRANFLPPIVSVQAHSAPLGIVFYKWNSEILPECPDIQPFPQWMDGYAFVAYHGSWNREVPTGYKVVYIAMDEKGNATSSPIDLLAHQPPNAEWEDGFRPVDVDFDACGRLLVTSDGTESSGSKIVRIEWLGSNSEEPSSAPSVGQDVTDSPTNSSHASLSPFSPSQGSELPSIASDTVSSEMPTIEPNSVPTASISAPSSMSEAPSTTESTSASSCSRVSIVLLLLVVNLHDWFDCLPTWT
jgi:hypothetical protein